MSDPVFLILAAASVLLALAFVVRPLLGGQLRGTLLALIVLVPAATVLLYLAIGTPEAIDPDTGQTGEVRSAVTDLARRAVAEPENADHWARLGLAYKSLEEFSSAEHAFRRALYIDDDNDFLRVELAETLLYASGRPQLPEEARQLLLRAAATGDDQKALWLLGLDAFQRQDHMRATALFERLLALLPEDSSVHATVAQHLQAARGEVGLSGQSPASSPTITLSVGIDETLASGLDGDETVFVVVRAAEGDGPPLAVRRLEVADLPAQLEIDAGDAMMAGRAIALGEQVTIMARVSISGDASAAEGDLEGRSAVLTIEDRTRAEVNIDEVL